MFSAREALRHIARPRNFRTTSRITARSLATDAQTKASSTKESHMAAIGALMGLTFGGAGIALMEPRQSPPISPFQRPGIPVEDANTPPPRPDLPTISLEDVAEHCDEAGLWYTFRGAVYDLTFFINGHPGGTPVSTISVGCGILYVVAVLQWSLWVVVGDTMN